MPDGRTFNEFKKPERYAYTWYLAAITGPDYIDRGGKFDDQFGQLDESDWGYWVAFDYGRWTDSYSWRNPEIGFIQDIDNNFQIYNETITCESSESEGSFSATYNAIIKRKNSGTESSVLHTFSRTANTTDDGQNRNVSITVNGNIQGLIETGLIETPNRTLV